jgi:hypothetical protein
MRFSFLSALLFLITGSYFCSGLDLSTAAELKILLPGIPVWIEAGLNDNDPFWIVTLEDGTVVEVSSAGGALRLSEGSQTGTDMSVIEAPLVSDPLPDGAAAQKNGYAAILTGPTGEYRHGILGDSIEASGFKTFRFSTVLQRYQPVGRYQLPGGTVFEALRPTMADLNDDGIPEILITASNADVGSAIYVFDINGTHMASSPAVGRGYRWIHLLGAGKTGPGGETEIITVRTPHIGGILQYYQLKGQNLVLEHALSGYSTHRIGSRNLDMAAIGNFSSGSQAVVLLPTQDFRSLAIIERTEHGSLVIWSKNLESGLTTNIEVDQDNGSPRIAWGSEDGVFHIMFENPDI